MAHLALYRRYRPTSFDKLIGQDAIKRTLKNQIESKMIGHAYLFTGTRGTGKTTTAKIFAKAVNCLSPINGSPCGKCSACLALNDPSNFDVLEIDAASNNGVDEIRGIKESVAFPPVSCQYKVYIIDEVHMLTPAAFNALLKTLEEPPKHAIFILATTEPQKMPQTILSRCMRFDFKLVATETIANLIEEVYKSLDKEYDKEAVIAIAKAGEGSVRDALSIADVCLSVASGKLTYNDVLEVLGATDRDKILSLVKSMATSNSSDALKQVDEIMSSGKSVGVAVKDVIETFRNLLVVKTCKDANKVLNFSLDVFESLKLIAESTETNRLLRGLEIFIGIETSLKYSLQPRVLFETACFKASRPDADYDITALAARVKALEDAIKNGVKPVATGVANSVQPPQKMVQQTEKVTIQSQNKVVEEKAESKEEVATNTAYRPTELLGLLSKALRQRGHTMLWALIQSLKADLKGNKFIIYTEAKNDEKIIGKPDNLAIIKEMLAPYGNYEVSVIYAGDERKEEQFDDGTQTLKNMFGSENVIIK